jgi:uncharacterized protein YfiM (DUF2279 family)
MADTNNLIFKIDVIMADGVALAFEDGSATVTGAAGFENEAKLSASGPDFSLRKRVARTMKARIQFDATVNPVDFAKMNGVQITMRDSFTGRKVIANGCAFKSMGDIGTGPVDFEFNLLRELQWM